MSHAGNEPPKGLHEMAELIAKDRLQPSLLDRLTDDAPQQASESREQRVLTWERLRECVLRDLSWLLNTEDAATAFDLEQYPEVRESVLNFGIPALSGVTASSIKSADLQRKVRAAILRFEPRIIAESLVVNVLRSEGESSHRTLSFEISGELWALPVPLRMFLRTELDLETGNVTINDQQR